MVGVIQTRRGNRHGLQQVVLPEAGATDQIRRRKLERIRDGATPRVLDLFSGCGGLSLGFHSAGFAISAAIEFDPLAAASHALNFHPLPNGEIDLRHAQSRDITEVEPERLVEELDLGAEVADSIDVVIGGPPCQAFARVGRAKLREVAEHPDAFRLDPRGNLYLRYLYYVRVLQPLVLLVENVPDVINYGGHNIPREMCDVLDSMGYRCAYTLLNAAYYGVPQMRERMFLIAYAQELDCEVEFPAPTHWIALPKGYEGSRQVALRAVTPDLFALDRAAFFTPAPEATPDLPPAITAQEAIGDLPPVTLHLEGKLRRGARRFDSLSAYPEGVAPSAYASAMRQWPGFEGGAGVYDHVIRSLPRDYAIFRRMHPGDQYPEAYRHALVLFAERLEELARAGARVDQGSSNYAALWEAIVPPYDASKFPNKWRKMEADRPARTLMAHLGKDGYSHIHYDSEQARTISVREAARLQSFPDGFRFSGTMNPAFRQIGNAVPPLLAAVLARAIHQQLRGD